VLEVVVVEVIMAALVELVVMYLQVQRQAAVAVAFAERRVRALVNLFAYPPPIF
jgi:hypothetical protein